MYFQVKKSTRTPLSSNQKSGQCCLLNSRHGGGGALERLRSSATMRHIGWRGSPGVLVVMWHATVVIAACIRKRCVAADVHLTAPCLSRCPCSVSSCVQSPPTSPVSPRGCRHTEVNVNTPVASLTFQYSKLKAMLETILAYGYVIRDPKITAEVIVFLRIWAKIQ
jgi:hypothetical protein